MKAENYNKTIVVRGAGEMASGVIHKLFNSGYTVYALEKPQPVCVRRLVCFANAFYEHKTEVEGVQSILVENLDDAHKATEQKLIPLLVDPDGVSIKEINPFAVIDGRMLKKDITQNISSSPILIGLGPGFTTGQNCHMVIETNRGDDLGKVIHEGKAREHTGIPAEVNNYTHERVLRSPADGIFKAHVTIGDLVGTNDIVGKVNDIAIKSKFDGTVRGLIHDGLTVMTDQKVGDINPGSDKDICLKISDKASAIGNGVLEALRHISKSYQI